MNVSPCNPVSKPQELPVSPMWSSLLVGGSLKASRLIMACYSPVMEALFYGSTGLTAVAGDPVDIRDGTFRGFKGMLDFIYQENDFTLADLLENPGKEQITESDELERVLEVFFFADKYQINSLISLCKNALLYEIKFSSRNLASMYNVVSSYQDNLRDVYSLLISKMKDFQQEFFDIEIAEEKSSCHVGKSRVQSKIKITVNKACAFRFDCQKQKSETCKDGSCSNPFKGITWQMEGSLKEIKQENKDTFEFYAEANKIITLNFEMCQDCTCFNCFKIKNVKDAKYKMENLMGNWERVLSFHSPNLAFVQPLQCLKTKSFHRFLRQTVRRQN